MDLSKLTKIEIDGVGEVVEIRSQKWGVIWTRPSPDDQNVQHEQPSAR